jgi:hypothetical protein
MSPTKKTPLAREGRCRKDVSASVFLPILFDSNPGARREASPLAHFSGTLSTGWVSGRLTNELYAAKQPTATSAKTAIR